VRLRTEGSMRLCGFYLPLYARTEGSMVVFTFMRIYGSSLAPGPPVWPANNPKSGIYQAGFLKKSK
jgi:hypothetical protein